MTTTRTAAATQIMELDYRRAAELLFSAENPRLTYLGIFFSVEENMQQILPLFSKKKKMVSKTLIEWTIIKLAKLIPLEFEWNGQRINIGDEYTLFRSQGTKEHSDPFARRPRTNTGVAPHIDNIKFDFLYDQKDATKSIETTEAQLTFFKWIIVRGILNYIQRHVVRLNQLYTIYSTLRKQTNLIKMKVDPGSEKMDGAIERNITIFTTPRVTTTVLLQSKAMLKQHGTPIGKAKTKSTQLTWSDLVERSQEWNVTFVKQE